jgi:hypothetical protein
MTKIRIRHCIRIPSSSSLDLRFAHSAKLCVLSTLLSSGMCLFVRRYITSLKDIIHALKLRLIRERMGITSAFENLDTIPIRPLFECRRCFFLNVPAEEEVEGELRDQAFPQLFMSYGNTVFQLPNVFVLPLSIIIQRTRQSVTPSFFSATAKVWQLSVPYELSTQKNIVCIEEIDCRTKPTAILSCCQSVSLPLCSRLGRWSLL